MKKYIRSSRYTEFNDWVQEDIDLWHQIDWKSRNYEEYPVEEDSFDGYLILYGIRSGGIKIPCRFQKYLRSNPIYAPYYGPVDEYSALQDYRKKGYQIVGPMYDGRSHGKYHVHDRFETQELYDALSD